MHAVAVVILVFWVAFWVYWFVAAFTGVKAGRTRWGRASGPGGHCGPDRAHKHSTKMLVPFAL